MNPLATLTPPPRRAAPAVADLVRRRAWLAGGALALLLAVNLPAFLRLPLECDPLLFDLFVRDIGRGRVLYRDMLENNTPAMIAIHAGVRWAFGWSPEALRAADLLVVGTGIGLLAAFFHPGRPDRKLLAALLLAAAYLSTAEFCHCQRDVWCLLPVAAGLHLRRANLARPAGWRAVAEGVVWGLAVWLKPHTLLVAAAVWLAGRPARRRAVVIDALGVFAGGLLIGGAGIGAMAACGMWGPYLDHLTNWASEYPGANLYGPYSRWLCRLVMAIRQAPWSGLYLAAVPAAVVTLAVRSPGRPERPLAAAALLAWFAQAVFLQHVFDYVHVTGELLAVALLLALADDLPAGRRGWSVGVLAAVVAVGHVGWADGRLRAWRECVTGPATPGLRDRLTRHERVGWVELTGVADYLTAAGAEDGQVTAVSDMAMPVYLLTGLSPPTRYYILWNNLLAYRSHRAEILAALEAVPDQRYAVVNLAALRWYPPPGSDGKHPRDWPLSDDWYGPRRWADRVAFRSGRYVVVRLTGPEVPTFLADVSDLGATDP